MYTFRFVTYNLNGKMDLSQMERYIYESQLNETKRQIHSFLYLYFGNLRCL